MNKKQTKEDINLSDAIKELKQITEWFEKQDEINIEESISKIKQGAVLVKECKEKLKEMENTFEEIRKELDSE